MKITRIADNIFRVASGLDDYTDDPNLSPEENQARWLEHYRRTAPVGFSPFGPTREPSPGPLGEDYSGFMSDQARWRPEEDRPGAAPDPRPTQGWASTPGHMNWEERHIPATNHEYTHYLDDSYGDMSRPDRDKFFANRDDITHAVANEGWRLGGLGSRYGIFLRKPSLANEGREYRLYPKDWEGGSWHLEDYGPDAPYTTRPTSSFHGSMQEALTHIHNNNGEPERWWNTGFRPEGYSLGFMRAR